MSEQGVFWQAHNNQLIKTKRYEKVADAIESLEAYKRFGGVNINTGKYTNIRVDGDNIRIADCTQCGAKGVSVIHHKCPSDRVIGEKK